MSEERGVTRGNLLTLRLADAAGRTWAQAQSRQHHYLRTRVPNQCRPLAYLVEHRDLGPVGCLIFGRPQAQRCYVGGLTYGSLADVRDGRAFFERWEILNLARVWLDPRIQLGGMHAVPHAASQMIAQALRRVVYDYLLVCPPIDLLEPWHLSMCLSYCDTRVPGHYGTIYRAAGFWRVRRNAAGIETWARALRPLRGAERRRIAELSLQHPRSRQWAALVEAELEQERVAA